MIAKFRGQYSFLSNFYETPVIYEDMVFPSVEAAFQAAKTETRALRVGFTNATPVVAKRMGRELPLRKDWEKIKSQVMLECLRSKFAAGNTLARMLMETGKEELVEGNFWHDNEWGNCTCDRCSDRPGRNLLGKLLMQVRDELNATS